MAGEGQDMSAVLDMLRDLGARISKQGDAISAQGDVLGDMRSDMKLIVAAQAQHGDQIRELRDKDTSTDGVIARLHERIIKLEARVGITHSVGIGGGAAGIGGLIAYIAQLLGN